MISRTVRSSLSENLRDAILLGEFVPGQNLRLEEIARRFDVSTTPVREALSDLAAEGLVSIFPHRGAVVTRLSPADLQDIYEIREPLEVLATRLAVPRLTEPILKQLHSYVDQMDIHAGELAKWIKLNGDFHNTLYSSSGRPYLCELTAMLRNRTQHYLHAFISDLGGMPNAQIEHRNILKACKCGDAEQAASIVFDHLNNTGRALIEFVRQQEESKAIPQKGTFPPGEIQN